MTRGELRWADLGVPFRSESGFRRPVLIVHDDAYTHSRLNTVIIAPLTTNLLLEDAPGNACLSREESGLSGDSVVVVTRLSALDKERVIEREGKGRRIRRGWAVFSFSIRSFFTSLT